MTAKDVVFKGLAYAGPSLGNVMRDRQVVFSTSKHLFIELVAKLGYSDPGRLLPNVHVYLASSELPACFRSSDGRFHTLVVYSAHPADADFFVPLAGYHPFLLQDKRAEMVRLAASLGAKSIRLLDTERRGRKADVHADASVPADGAPVDVGAKAEGHSSSGTAFNLSATFGKPKRPPALPADLRWYHREPLWKAMAETRLAHATETIKVQFKYDQDFGVNADLVGKVAGFGLSAGARFRQWRRSSRSTRSNFTLSTSRGHPLGGGAILSFAHR